MSELMGELAKPRNAAVCGTAPRESASISAVIPSGGYDAGIRDGGDI
jgi:hypothetical protein